MTAAAALLASVAWGVADFLGGLKSRAASVLVVLLLAQISGVLAIALVVALAGNSPPASVLWAALAGFFPHPRPRVVLSRDRRRREVRIAVSLSLRFGAPRA
jgi:hypothetical protein